MTDFKTIIRLFSEAGIECVIVGGLAATIHGSSRLTQDVDLVYSPRRTWPPDSGIVKPRATRRRADHPGAGDAPAGVPELS